MKDVFKINAHSHVLPYPEDIPLFMRENQLFWVDNERKFMHQENWKRPITAESFFPQEKMEWMQKNHLNHSVVLTLSQLYGNSFSENIRGKALQFQNDFNASLQQDYPKFFTSGFVVNPKNIQEAQTEIIRCVEDLQLDLLCLPTHYLDNEGKWKVVFDSETEPIWEIINQYGLAVEIHPYDGEKFIQLENQSWRFHLVWMLAQCADAYHFLTLQNFPERYPNIRFCFAHGGMLAQANLGRRITGFEGRPDLFPQQTHPKKYLSHPNIYFDSLLHDILTLELAIKRQGSLQILAGLDDPYPLGEMDDEQRGTYPGKLLDEALQNHLITSKDYQDIWQNNTLRWLYGTNESKLKSFWIRVS